MSNRALQVFQGVFIDDTRIGNELAIRLIDALASANLYIGPKKHRVSISQLALAFGVSDQRAQQAVDALGFLFREPVDGSALTGKDGGTNG